MTLGELAGRLVVHTPHAGLDIPASVRDQFTLSDTELAMEAHGSADLWTDALGQSAWPAATHVAVAVSRLVVGVERYRDDDLEEMARVGRGAVYTRTHDGGALRRPLSIGERDALIASYHAPHWPGIRPPLTDQEAKRIQPCARSSLGHSTHRNRSARIEKNLHRIVPVPQSHPRTQNGFATLGGVSLIV
jgi:hypothetical protein